MKRVAVTIIATLAVLASPAAASAAGPQTLTWAVVPSPNVPKSFDELNAVSCPRAAACVAVGDEVATAKGSRVHPLIESWNGTRWAITPGPSDPGGELFGVSCPSPTTCVAVGFTTSASGDITTLAEQWNGTRWSIVPGPSRPSMPQLVAVSCLSRSECTASGSYTDGNGSLRTLIETWNGTRWTIVPSPSHGSADNSLAAVSCASATFCAAVGTHGFPQFPLIESWNGTRWSIVPSPAKPKAFLSGVACLSAVKCIAVGSYLDRNIDYRPLAESWNGSTWSLTPVPRPRLGQFEAVSCVSAANCTAAGDYQPTRLSNARDFIESWNGTGWSRVPVPDKGLEGGFHGVSCASARSCTAAGLYTTNGTDEFPLVETGTASG